MTREERNKVLEETKEVMDLFCEALMNDLVKDTVYSDEDTLIMVKFLRISKSMCDFAEFQTKQLDSIEDKLDQLNNLIGTKKEAI